MERGVDRSLVSLEKIPHTNLKGYAMGTRARHETKNSQPRPCSSGHVCDAITAATSDVYIPATDVCI